MVPPRRKKSEHSMDILHGKCPTTTPPFMTATAYRSTVFRGSHISLYIWCPRMHDSLRSSSLILHVVAKNSNLFPCLEIIGVFNFRIDARIWKFFTWKFSDTKIFSFTVFIVPWTASSIWLVFLANVPWLSQGPLHWIYSSSLWTTSSHVSTRKER